jgi:hypothetical protein
MAVTDLTDSLPYWARQGPGPTGGPGAAPQGGGVGGQPPPGMNMQAWLQYLSQMAGVAPQPNPANMPSPDAQNVDMVDLSGHGDGNNPPVTPFAVPPAPPVASNGPPVAQNGPAPGSILPQARGVSPPPPGPPGPVQGPPQSPTPWFTGGNTPMPWQGPNPANVASPAAQPVSAQRPVPGPLATGGATAMGASSNPRFVGIDRPNANPGIGGGMLGGARGGPQGTALNLAGLFGGGGQNPNVPAANAQPMSGRLKGPLAQGGAPSGDDWNIDPATGDVVPNPDVGNIDLRSNAPWKYGPLQKGNIWKTSGGPRPRS